MARRRGAKKIDTVHWTYGSFSFNAQGAGSPAVNVLSAQHLPETILRIRGSFSGYVDGASAPGKLVGCGLGLILVPEGSGTTGTWTPITDGDAPWLWVSYFELGYEEMVTDVVDVPGISSYREVIDSKAMRHVRNQELQCVLEVATILTVTNVNINGQIRVLTGS